MSATIVLIHANPTSTGAILDVVFLKHFLIPMVLLMVALVVGVTMAYRIWQETHEDEEPASEAEILSELEQAHAEGELDDAELRRVRAILNHPRPEAPVRSRPDRFSPGPRSARPKQLNDDAPPGDSAVSDGLE